MFLCFGLLLASSISGAADLNKLDSQILCQQDTSLEKAVAKVNSSLQGKPKISIPIMGSPEKYFMGAAIPVAVSAPFILHDGANYLVCVTVTKQ
jgi:hypothetical protein